MFHKHLSWLQFHLVPAACQLTLYGLDLEVESDEGEHETLEILDQVVETPAKNTKQFQKYQIFI